jgi:hypothetical protein
LASTLRYGWGNWEQIIHSPTKPIDAPLEGASFSEPSPAIVLAPGLSTLTKVTAEGVLRRLKDIAKEIDSCVTATGVAYDHYRVQMVEGDWCLTRLPFPRYGNDADDDLEPHSDDLAEQPPAPLLAKRARLYETCVRKHTLSDVCVLSECLKWKAALNRSDATENDFHASS